MPININAAETLKIKALTIWLAGAAETADIYEITFQFTWISGGNSMGEY
jgi:hypothetical protein